VSNNGIFTHFRYILGFLIGYKACCIGEICVLSRCHSSNILDSEQSIFHDLLSLLFTQFPVVDYQTLCLN